MAEEEGEQGSGVEHWRGYELITSTRAKSGYAGVYANKTGFISMVWNGKTQVGLGQFHSARLAAAAYTRCRAAVEREGVTETASLQQLAAQVRDGAAAAERAAERPPPPPHASGRGCGEEDPYYGQGELAGEGDPGPRVGPDGDPLLASLHGVRLHRSTKSNTGYACVRQVWHAAVGPPLP